MAKTTKIIFLKQDVSDAQGMLYIRSIIDRKQTRKSLKIRVTEKQFDQNFDEGFQRFRPNKNYPEYEQYNIIIEKALAELSNYDNDLTLIPEKDKSILLYWKNDILKNLSNGSKIKHEVIINKLESYLTHAKMNDLLFVDITPPFLRDLQTYLTTVASPKKLSINTATHYLKVLKSIITRAIGDDYYSYHKHPFQTVKLKKTKKENKNVLSTNDVTKIIECKPESNIINIVKNAFLFQFFCQGMRVSDMLRLRYSNIENGRIVYRMLKTNTPLSISINAKIAAIIAYNLKIEINDIDLRYHIPDEVIKPISQYLKDNGLDKFILSDNQFRIDEMVDVINWFHPTFSDKLPKQYRGFKIISGIPEMEVFIDLYYNFSDTVLTEKINRISKAISNKNKSKFIFPFLDNDLFADVDDFNFITEAQYKHIKHATIVYNRNLKRLQDSCSIKVTMSSHTPRHTYTALLLENGNANLYDISQSLGHSNIKITESYIQSGFANVKVDNLNKNISDMF